MEEYYLEQERLYYIFDKQTDTIHSTFVLNMPGPVAEMMEAKFKADAIVDLAQLSLAQLYQISMELIQSHCRSQDLRRHMKQIEKSSLQKFCHYAKQCKSKKKLPAKLLQMIQHEDFDDDIYTWSDSPLGAVYTLDKYPLSDTEDTDSTTCTDSNSGNDDLVLAVHDPLLAKLAMQPSSLFWPHIKIILNPSEDTQVALTALIDTGAMCSFIREACVPNNFYVPTKVSFGSASGRDFYSKKITRPIEIQPFMIRHGFFAFDYSGEDILLGTDFLSLVAPILPYQPYS
ncbi:hypothetical protein WN943_019253 [Citrus x changshan-huyou]